MRAELVVEMTLSAQSGAGGGASGGASTHRAGVDDRVEALGDNGPAATEDPVLSVGDRCEGCEGEEFGEHRSKDWCRCAKSVWR